MGEAAALRNQLAQIDEHLAAIERDAARTAREEQAALADLEWLEASAREIGEKAAARHQELEALIEKRRQAEEAAAAMQIKPIPKNTFSILVATLARRCSNEHPLMPTRTSICNALSSCHSRCWWARASLDKPRPCPD
jgi:hypothetical protein